jgi:hypothetical protein
MSLSGSQSPDGLPSHGRTQSNPPPSETHDRLSTHNAHSTTGSIALEHVNDAALAMLNQETVTSRTPPGPEKENSPQGGGSLAVEESVEARLERLGKQRPKVFDSLWAEIGFVFSISMSQVLSVISFSSFQEHLTDI